MGTKVELTMKLKIHWNATAQAVAWLRMVLGKSSAMYTQQMGPQLNMKQALYTMMLITGTRAGRLTTLERATPRAPSAIPREPVMRRGFRPSFSTVNTATSVKEMLITPMITVKSMLLLTPMDSKMRGAKYSTALMPIICWNTDSMQPMNTTRKP